MISQGKLYCPTFSYVLILSKLIWLSKVGGLYFIDNGVGLDRRFDGIGALDAGATSKLLVNYSDPYKSQILDYLFKPNFGASLQILKVEIGGDAQSTDGTESSHMHYMWEENYQRGYEWWLMVEAKKRNPNIKLYGLAWAYPGWIGQGTQNPYAHPELTAMYVTKWVTGAKKYYDLTIDYIGIWNERNYDIKYVETLRRTLDEQGMNHTQIVAADNNWDVANDVLKDPKFASVIDYIGAHYPGTYSTDAAMKTGKQLWASEDFNTFNDNSGGGCWARVVNRNYVNGHMTSTICWNLIASYYESLPYGRNGLMTAESPWTGNYVVESPIWITAHTTQFTEIGWSYLKHGSGVGMLDKGGSYVSLISPDKQHFTMVIETMSHDHAVCRRPPLPPYTVQPQNATFILKGSLLSSANILNVWYTKLGFDGSPSTYFKKMVPVKVVNGQFELGLGVDEIFTLTTLNLGNKGTFSKPPPPAKPFPLPYSDSFDGYVEYTEAPNLTPQVGVWEIRTSSDSDHGKINRQVVLEKPCYWCDPDDHVPFNIIGNSSWTDIKVKSDILIPSVNGSSGAFIAARLFPAGCFWSGPAKAVFFLIHPADSTYMVYTDYAKKKIISHGVLPVKWQQDKWITLTLEVQEGRAVGYAGTSIVFNITLSADVPTSGYAAIGTENYGFADYDNFSIDQLE